MEPAAPPPARPRRLPREPLGWLLVGVAAGMLLVVGRLVRPGIALVALSVAAGAVARAVLPPRTAGLLVVRSRAIDVAVMAGLAVGLVVLLVAVPFHGRG